MNSGVTGVSAWNEYLKTFLNELCETFPECTDMVVLINVVDAMLDEDETSVLDKFVEEIEPHTEALTEMDEEFFLSSDIDFLKRLGVRQYWTPDLEDETKQAIWQYLQTLLVMGKTIQSIPPNAMRALEDFASKMTNQLESGEVDLNDMDLQTLGLGAMQHLRSQTGADSEDYQSMFSEDGDLARVTENMSMMSMATQAAEGLAAKHGLQGFAAPPTASASSAGTAGTGGGLGRLLQQTWGNPTPPLHGNHPIFHMPPDGPSQ